MNIKDFREKKHLTQAQLAKKVGVSLSSVRMWEQEVTKPTDENLKKLLEIMGK